MCDCDHNNHLIFVRKGRLALKWNYSDKRLSPQIFRPFADSPLLNHHLGGGSAAYVAEKHCIPTSLGGDNGDRPRSAYILVV